MNLDFSSAKLKHSMWKMRLRGYLDGKPGLTAAEAISHRECELGKWLYTEGFAKYASIDEMKRLEREHEELHRTIRAIVELKAAGKKDAAEAEFKKVGPISQSIMDLLTEVQKKV